MMKYISYGLIAALLVTAGFASVQYGRANYATARVDVLTDSLNNQIHSFNLLKASVESSNRITVGMSTRLDKLADNNSFVTQRVVTLEKSDEKIHDFLSTPLPANGCLLDNSCDYPGSVLTTGVSTSATLQSSQAGAGTGSSGHSSQ